jgi:hypothetical protein
MAGPFCSAGLVLLIWKSEPARWRITEADGACFGALVTTALRVTDADLGELWRRTGTVSNRGSHQPHAQAQQEHPGQDPTDVGGAHVDAAVTSSRRSAAEADRNRIRSPGTRTLDMTLPIVLALLLALDLAAWR